MFSLSDSENLFRATKHINTFIVTGYTMQVHEILTEAPKTVKSYGKGMYSGFEWEKLKNGDIRVTTPDGNTSIVDKKNESKLKSLADDWIKDWEAAKKAHAKKLSDKKKKAARKAAVRYAKMFVSAGGVAFTAISLFLKAARAKEVWDEHVAWQQDHYYNFTLGYYGLNKDGTIDLEKNMENFLRAQDVAVGAFIANSAGIFARAIQEGLVTWKVVKNIRNMIAAGSIAFSGFIGPAVTFILFEAAFWAVKFFLGDVDNVKSLMNELYKDGINKVREEGLRGGYFKEAFLKSLGGSAQNVANMTGVEANAKQIMKMAPQSDAADDSALSSPTKPDTSKSKVAPPKTKPGPNTSTPPNTKPGPNTSTPSSSSGSLSDLVTF